MPATVEDLPGANALPTVGGFRVEGETAGAGRGNGLPKLPHLQILRAIAASLVVVDHAFGNLGYQGYDVGPYLRFGYFVGGVGVAAFFILSGLIMIRQSADRFGSARNSLVFAYHRVLRIVPMYWLATVLYLVSKMRWHIATPHAAAQLSLSLSFIPDYFAANKLMQPILEAGWTLNYEMGFYMLFALCLLLPRRKGVTVLLGVLGMLALLGRRHFFPLGNTPASLLNFYTDWRLLLFAGGVAAGLVEIRVKRIPRFEMPISPSLLILIPVAIALAHPERVAGVWYQRPAIYCGVVVVLCAMASLERPGWVNRGLIFLGDASYSTYLFHVWVVGWMLEAAIHFHVALKSPVASVVVFLVACVVGANVVGGLIYIGVERPLTRAMRRVRWPADRGEAIR